jgi:D-threo-aldose 1-dehydrogenase
LFHGGFLTGGAFFDYRKVDPQTSEGRRLFAWRDAFNAICARHGATPAHVCVAFARSIPGVVSVALNTSDPARVPENIAMATQPIPAMLWRDLLDAKLLDAAAASYVGKDSP